MTSAQGPPGSPFHILAVATQGSGSDDEARLKTLLGRLSVELFPFDRGSKRQSAQALLAKIRHEKPDLVVMEGTGIGGGLAILLGRILAGVPYVFSSGDAIEPFVRALKPWAAPLFGLYERRLCKHAAGFIGWTPYLTGRALTYGTTRGMTAPGWAPFTAQPEARQSIREQLGIPANALVFGIVGSLAWNKRLGYGYGLELIEALKCVKRSDVWTVIVGDGSGRSELEARATSRCVFTGRVAREEVPAYLSSFDVASLPQSLDGVGMFRYTTKISEYLAAGLPIVTGHLPLAYDLDDGWIWRIRGENPWSPVYHQALADLIDGLTSEDLVQHRTAVPRNLDLFDKDRQVERVTSFLLDILNEHKAHTV
jgi:hypothetical protein